MKLFWQISIGLLLAAVLVGGLQWWVVARGQAAAASDSASSQLGQLGDGPGPERAPADPGTAGRRLLPKLEGEAESFHLAPSRAALPADCAPVLVVIAGGRIEVPVAAPLAAAPGPVRWASVGIVLPADSLGGLSPAERASLVAIWSQLSGADLPTPGRVFLHGCSARSGELERLLRWAR